MGLFAILMTDTAVRLPQPHLTGLVAVPATTESASFRCRVDMTPPASGGGGGPGSAADDASRAHQHWTIAWEVAAGPIVSGDRLRVNSKSFGVKVFELAGEPHQHAGLTSGVLATTVQAVDYDDLYPFLGELRALGGASVESNIPIGLWQTTGGRAEAAGAIYDYDAEVPYNYGPQMRVPNRELLVAGAVYKIVDATAHRTAPRITMRLRHHNPAG